jgi:soluble lytic murein transglycosylase-like protein
MRICSAKISLLVILAVVLLFQCKPEIFPGISRDVLVQKLKAADFSFFEKIGQDSPGGEEIFSFAPGAGLFFGLAAREAGKPELFTRFLLLEWTAGSQPYQQHAVRELLEYYNDQKLYDKTVALAAEFREKFPESKLINDINFLSIEALYWQKADDQVLDLSAKFFPQTDAVLKQKNPELLLFKTVSSARLGKPGWEILVRDFFFTIKASPLHTRLSTYLSSEKEKLNRFSPFEQELFEAKSLLGNGDFIGALKKYERLFPQLGIDSLKASALIADFTAACIGATPAPWQAALLVTMAGRAQGEDKLALYESAGKIYYALKDYASAKACYEIVLAASSDPLLKKRLVWRLLKMSLSGSPEEAAAAFASRAPRWDDPGFYSDVTDELVSLLVRNRRFQLLLSLDGSLKQYLGGSQQAQLSYICARALRLNLCAFDGNRDEKIKSLYQKAILAEDRGYYSFLSSYLLKEKNEIKIDTDKPAAAPAETGEEEAMVAGYITFGLYSRAYSRAAALHDEIKDESISNFAARLSENERPYEAIQMLGLIRGRDKYEFSRRDYEAYYPRAFSPLVAQFATEYKVDDALYFSLIRQESAFHPGIASSAGAVGLTQLMPETGAWIATQLKLKNPNLKDPAQSIRFGAYYLSFLSKRLIDIPYVLAGYNAGPTNARAWKQTYADFPADLFVEAIEFPETRNFIKDIFSARVYYQQLYKNSPLAQSVELFYHF